MGVKTAFETYTPLYVNDFMNCRERVRWKKLGKYIQSPFKDEDIRSRIPMGIVTPLTNGIFSLI